MIRSTFSNNSTSRTSLSSLLNNVRRPWHRIGCSPLAAAKTMTRGSLELSVRIRKTDPLSVPLEDFVTDAPSRGQTIENPPPKLSQNARGPRRPPHNWLLGRSQLRLVYPKDCPWDVLRRWSVRMVADHFKQKKQKAGARDAFRHR